MLEEVLSSYGINTTAKIQPHGSGLIHNTWKVTDQSNEYILQRINHNVFKQPEYIARNIEAIASWLEKNQPEYFFVTPLETENNGSLLHITGEGYFRLLPFVKDSLTYDTAQSPQQAFEAARQFGLFTCVALRGPKRGPVGSVRFELTIYRTQTDRLTIRLRSA